MSSSSAATKRKTPTSKASPKPKKKTKKAIVAEAAAAAQALALAAQQAMAPACTSTSCSPHACAVTDPSPTPTDATTTPPSSPLSPRTIVSWNVNGVRAAVKNGLHTWVATHPRVDVLCMTEVKATVEDAPTLDGFTHRYWNASKSKKGYSGSAIYTKHKPRRVLYDLDMAGAARAAAGDASSSSKPTLMEAMMSASKPQSKHDQEGRVLTCEFDDYYVVNVYVPNSGAGLVRHTYRTQEWDVAFASYLSTLQRHKPLIVVGDLNVAHLDIDIHSPATNQASAGFTPEERANFGRLLLNGHGDAGDGGDGDGDSVGLVDVYRHYHPTTAETCYTYFGYRTNGRATNRGWRLDYFLVSPALLPTPPSPKTSTASAAAASMAASTTTSRVRVHGTGIDDERVDGVRISDHVPIVLCVRPRGDDDGATV